LGWSESPMSQLHFALFRLALGAAPKMIWPFEIGQFGAGALSEPFRNAYVYETSPTRHATHPIRSAVKSWTNEDGETTVFRCKMHYCICAQKYRKSPCFSANSQRIENPKLIGKKVAAQVATKLF